MDSLRNPFPSRVRELYIFNYRCFKCGRNGPLELHHIFGRESPAAFNACPLCHWCHEAIKHTKEERSFLFFKNQEFLLENEYKPREEDFDLIKRHPFLIESEEYVKLYGKK